MCIHYQNHVKILAPCCEKFYKCRLCHDKHENHQLNRYDVKTIKCVCCSTTQEVSAKCKCCSLKFATYSCLICVIFSNNIDDEIFHCYDCGICRKGGRKNYYHCAICNICIKLDCVAKHTCIQNCQSKRCIKCHLKINDKLDEVLLLPTKQLVHTNCYT